MDWENLLCRKRQISNDVDTPSSADPRSAYERDCTRILFSTRFRSLQGKTQVFPLPSSDLIHNRLTHSIEVSRVGESLGRLAGRFVLDKDAALSNNYTEHDFGNIVSAACLAHDIGNPPFGHSGEAAISEYFKTGLERDFGGSTLFSDEEELELKNVEGNATGFRIITRHNYQGFDLTYATLGAYTKYPWNVELSLNDDTYFSGMCPNVKNKAKPVTGSNKTPKYGFYSSEKDIFAQVATTLGLIKLKDSPTEVWCRHPLAFLVEAADDICYRIIDLEDGYRVGLISFDETERLLKPLLDSSINQSYYDGLGKEDKVGYLRGKAIFSLVSSAIEVFKDKYDDIMNGEYCGELISESDKEPALAEMKGFIARNIYMDSSVLHLELAGFTVLEYLVSGFSCALGDCSTCGDSSAKHRKLLSLMPEHITSSFAGGSEENEFDYKRAIDVIEYISSMTDKAATTLYRKLSGIDVVI